jgi:hypothetical protein
MGGTRVLHSRARNFLGGQDRACVCRGAKRQTSSTNAKQLQPVYHSSTFAAGINPQNILQMKRYVATKPKQVSLLLPKVASCCQENPKQVTTSTCQNKLLPEHTKTSYYQHKSKQTTIKTNQNQGRTKKKKKIGRLPDAKLRSLRGRRLFDKNNEILGALD